MRLEQMRARIVREGYSRGERLDSGEEEKEPLDLSTATTSTERPAIASLNQADFARAALLSQQAAASDTSRSVAPSPHTSLALKWNAYAKDQEGMEQELKTLRRDKRHLLTLIDTHTQQLTATTHTHTMLLNKLTTLAARKGMQLTTAADGRSKAEPAGEVGEGDSVRLNPMLSAAQVVLALQREVARLELDKERKECEQDDIEEQQRLEEERAAEDDKRERQLSNSRGGGDDEYSQDEDEDEQQQQHQPRLTQRHRLRMLREKKAALLQKVHEMQEQLQQSRDSAISSKDSTAAEALTSSITTARTHADTYEEQLVQRQRQLSRVREENARLAQQLHAATSTAKSAKHRSRP